MIVDCRPGESEEEAIARVEAEARVRAATNANQEALALEQAEPVSEPSEVERLASEAGAPSLPTDALAPTTGYVDAEDEAVRDGWEVRDLSSLDWALSRIADLEAERAENEQLKQEAIARIEAKAAKLNATVDRGLAFFRSRVISYAQTHRAELLKGGKKKSRKLPHGVIKYRKAGGGYEVTDVEKLLEWARSQPAEFEVLRIKEEPALGNIKKHADETGELPPGLEQLPETEVVEIDADGMEA